MAQCLVQAELGLSLETQAGHVRAALQALKVEEAEVEEIVRQFLHLGFKHKVDVHVSATRNQEKLHLTVDTKFPHALLPILPAHENWEFRGEARTLPIECAANLEFWPAGAKLHFNDFQSLRTRGKLFHFSTKDNFACIAFTSDDKSCAPKLLGLITHTCDYSLLTGTGKGAWHKLLCSS